MVKIINFLLFLNLPLFVNAFVKNDPNIPEDYYLSNAGDTVFGNFKLDIAYISEYSKDDAWVRFEKKSGEKIKVHASECIEIRKDGIVYMSGKKKQNLPLTFYEILLKKGDFSFVKETERFQGMDINSYFIFKNKEYVELVPSSDSDGVLGKYFKDCARYQTALTKNNPVNYLKKEQYLDRVCK